MRKLIILLLFFLGCGGNNPNWDLSKPIFIIGNQFPNSSLFQIGAQNAIIATGGTVEFKLSTQQRLVLYSGNPQQCNNLGEEAYSDLTNDDHHIGICPSIFNQMPPQEYADDIMKHEWGHIVSGRSDHLPCSSGSIMTPDRTCHKPGIEYTSLDFMYMSTSNVINGKL